MVAESEDGKALLVGEAKWGRKTDGPELEALLREKAARLPFLAGRTPCLGLWLAQPHRPRQGRSRQGRSRTVCVFGPHEVMDSLS